MNSIIIKKYNRERDKSFCEVILRKDELYLTSLIIMISIAKPLLNELIKENIDFY